jgi:hypothetical protein
VIASNTPKIKERSNIRGLILIRFERVLVIDAQRRILVLIPRNAVAGNQKLNIGPHEAAERVFWGTDDQFASHIKAGIDQNRASGPRLENSKQCMLTRFYFLMNGLNTRRHIDMSDGRNFQVNQVQPVDPKELLVLIRLRMLAFP